MTGPYLEGAGAYILQMHQLRDAEDARRMVEYWADEGATSFKAYMHITRDELKAAIEAAHARRLKVTGHLCSVGFREAAALGIDDLEHGFLVNTQLDSGKKPDECPDSSARPTPCRRWTRRAPGAGPDRDLVAHKVAVTSTLPVFETFVPGRAPLRRAVLEADRPQARESYLRARSRRATGGGRVAARRRCPRGAWSSSGSSWRAGGLLLAGLDPTGNGGTVPGFGDQREIELLVEAGFTPRRGDPHRHVERRAVYLGRADQIGTLAAGKERRHRRREGRPATRIADIENVETRVQGRRRLRPAEAPGSGARALRAVLGSEGVHHRAAGCAEVRDVACGDAQAMPERRGRDQAVLDRHRATGLAQPCEQLRPAQAGLRVPVDAQQPAHARVEPSLEPAAPPAAREQQDAEPDLAEDDRIDDESCLVPPEPVHDGRPRAWPRGLAQHVGVDQVPHSESVDSDTMGTK